VQAQAYLLLLIVDCPWIWLHTFWPCSAMAAAALAAAAVGSSVSAFKLQGETGLLTATAAASLLLPQPSALAAVAASRLGVVSAD
jgi:hypothetical protein